MDRELFVRNIPPEMTSTKEIVLGRALPPLRFGLQDLIDAVLEIDPSVDTSVPHRLNIVQPGLRVAIGIPSEDPLPLVLLRVASQSDRAVADRFIGELLAKLEARAFDTESATLIFTPTS